MDFQDDEEYSDEEVKTKAAGFVPVYPDKSEYSDNKQKVFIRQPLILWSDFLSRWNIVSMWLIAYVNSYFDWF